MKYPWSLESDSYYYRLRNKKPVPINFAEYVQVANNFERERLVEQQNVTSKVRVSTVFLCIDHSFGGVGPVVFETMVFGLYNDSYQTRAMTWEEAISQHYAALTWAKRCLAGRLRKRQKETAKFQFRTLRVGHGNPEEFVK